MGIFRGPRIVQDGLVLCLDAADSKSYPGSGTTWYDLSASGRNGTLLNGVSYNSSNKGSLVFDGSNDYINLSSTISGSHKTIDIWVYVPQTLSGNATGDQGPIISSTAAQTIWLGNFSTAAIDEVLNIWDGGRFTFSKGPINAGWRNLVFRWNNSYYDIFIDSVQSTVFIGPTASNSHCLLLSNVFRQIGSRTFYSQYFTGNIASLKVYTTSITDNDILQNYNATKGRFGL